MPDNVLHSGPKDSEPYSSRAGITLGMNGNNLMHMYTSTLFGMLEGGTCCAAGVNNMGAVAALNRWRWSKVLQAEEQGLSKQTCECSML